MAQDPDKPLDDGKISMPRIDSGMNRVAPAAIIPKNQRGGDIMRPGGKRKRSEREAQELLARARKRMGRCISTESENRKNGLDDDKFYSGEQWPSDIVQQRNADKRPVLTTNKLPTFVHQVTNDQRQNRPAINISPVGDRSDPEVARMYRGLIRAIERHSFADIAYDTGFESAARKGWGYWRITTEWEKPDSFNQVVCIKRVRNAFTVYMDPDAQEADGSDSRYAFVTEMLSRDEFKERFPDADQMVWTQGGVGDSFKQWIDQHQLRIAEYYEIEYEKKTLLMLSNGTSVFEDELANDVAAQIAANRIEVIAERESECPKVMWYKLTANEILEEREWPGKWIPIVQVVGEELDIEGKVRKWGIVRFAKDPQRQYNYWTTAETEMVALAPKAPWVVAEGQIEGYEDVWKTANTKSHTVLQYRAISLGGHPVPPPQRTQMAQVPTGIVQAKQGAAQDMMAVTGIRFDATMGERMYDESGRALRELRERGDMGSFHLIDNLARALRHTGEILVDLIPKVYDTKRIETILREDDSEETVQLDPNAPKPFLEGRHPQTNKVMKIFNPNMGRYGVTVTIGPSYATKRIEAAESMMDFARALPNAAALIMDLIAKNQDWPGAEEMATRLAKAIPPNLLSPDAKDVPPQVSAMLQAMDQQIKQLSQERQQLIAALTSQQADRQQRQDKIDKDFESKLLAVVQKAEASFNQHVGSQLKDLAQGVHLLRETLANPEEETKH